MHGLSPHSTVKTFAITGGIGSGKSTVARMFSDMPGVKVVNADDEARRVMVQNEAVRTALTSRFGPETFHDDGSLNRKWLATRVFANDDEVEALNQIVHPATRAAFLDAVQEAREADVRLFFYEVALLKELKIKEAVDGVILVDAPEEVRIRRVMERNNVSRDEVLARMQHQASSEELRRMTDFVIDNDGSLSELNDSVTNLYTHLVNQ